jgi:hypothetical protein
MMVMARRRVFTHARIILFSSLFFEVLLDVDLVKVV